MANLINKEEKDRIDFICMYYGIENYTIKPDGSIDVDGDVYLSGRRLFSLPLKFKTVSGSFNCASNDLTSLKGSPTEVGENFNCSNNELSSLEGGPTTVGGYFATSYNKLTSLVGSPITVGGDFGCSQNQLVSTYAGSADLEIGGCVYISENVLPLQFANYHDQVRLILKYQRHFEIWNDDLSMNVENFQVLLSEITDGLL